MGDYTAFFYGTLMAPQVLYRVCYGSAQPEPWQRELLTIQPAILHGYQRRRVRHADYPALTGSLASTESTSPTVRGTLVTGLTQGDIYRLDLFEGDEYRRKEVPVYPLTAGDGDSDESKHSHEFVMAQTYVWHVSLDRLEDDEWDFANFVQTKMARWVGSDDEYREVDEAAAQVLAEHDPTGGRGHGGAITRRLQTQE